MADSVIEDSDYFPGKDDLNWGYEEGKNIVVLYLKLFMWLLVVVVAVS